MFGKKEEEDIDKNNETTEAIAQATILSDDDLEFGSDIDNDPGDLGDNIVIPLCEQENTRNCSRNWCQKVLLASFRWCYWCDYRTNKCCQKHNL